jgi:hypothetical protein
MHVFIVPLVAIWLPHPATLLLVEAFLKSFWENAFSKSF